MYEPPKNDSRLHSQTVSPTRYARGLLPSAKSQTRFACFREARSKRRGFSSRRVLRYVNTKVAKQAFGGSFCEAKDPERSEWARRAPLCERVQSEEKPNSSEARMSVAKQRPRRGATSCVCNRASMMPESVCFDEFFIIKKSGTSVPLFP